MPANTLRARGRDGPPGRPFRSRVLPLSVLFVPSIALPQYLNAVVALEEITDRIVDGGRGDIAGNDA